MTLFYNLVCIVETLEPDVNILSLAIKSPGRSDIFLPIPESGNPKGLWFSLKEGSRYSLKFTFQVTKYIVSGHKYTNTVWKTGVKGALFASPSLSLSLSLSLNVFINPSLFIVDSTKQIDLFRFCELPCPFPGHTDDRRIARFNF